MIGTIFRAGLEAARAAFTAARDAAAAAGSPHIPPSPELSRLALEMDQDTYDRDVLGQPVALTAAPQARPLTAHERRAGVPAPVTPGERAQRAAAVLAGPRGYYRLGCGGSDPAAALPWGTYRAKPNEPAASVKVKRAAGAVWCDCSGAIAWVLGVPRKIAGYGHGYGWVSTDGLIADAEDPAVELVEYVPLGGDVRPWECLVVYGWHDDDGDHERDPSEIGHVGIVAGVPHGWSYTGPASLEALSVWHCASGESPTGAVRVSPGRAWRRRGRVVRVIG